MKERVVVEVAPGEILQVHTARGPVGQPITVPPGSTSVVVVFRDSMEIEATRLRREAKRSKKGKAGGRGGKKGKGAGRGGKRKRREKEAPGA